MLTLTRRSSETRRSTAAAADVRRASVTERADTSAEGAAGAVAEPFGAAALASSDVNECERAADKGPAAAVGTAPT